LNFLTSPSLNAADWLDYNFIKLKVTTQVTPLLAHDCVAVALESSCISIYPAALRSSRPVLGQNRSDMSSYSKRGDLWFNFIRCAERRFRLRPTLSRGASRESQTEYRRFLEIALGTPKDALIHLTENG